MADDVIVEENKAEKNVVEEKKKSPRQKLIFSLADFSRRKRNLTLVFFAVSLVVGAYTSYQALKNVDELSALYSQQTKLERFRASLPNIILPLNNYIMVKNKTDIEKIAQAAKEFDKLYDEVSSFSVLAKADSAELKKVSELMVEVSSLAEDITSKKIPLDQAGSIAIVAQSLVFVGQDKVNKVALHLNETIEQEVAAKIEQMTTLTLVVGLVVVGVIFLVFTLDRVFVTNIVRYISTQSKSIADSSENILSFADKQADASKTQADTVMGVTEELGEMSTSARKIAATASSVERIASATSVAAVEGGAAVQEAIGHMNLIRREVMAIAEKVSDSGRKAEQILESVDSIQEIADETHLLALNASIESAAAGEFGKRFSVVASEVRRLSERAREFTEEIQIVVNEVHESTKESIAVTQTGLESVAKGVQIAQRAGEALGKMENMSDKTSKAVRTIAMATQRQSDNSEEFVVVMKTIAELIQDSASQMTDSKVAAEQLNEVAEKLRTFV